MENLLYNKAPFKGLSSYDVKEIFKKVETPCYVIDEAMLRHNGEILKSVQERTGCKILLAQKAFSNFNTYGILSECLAGTEASGLYEARLGAEEMPDGEVHVFCGAYKERDFDELLKYADHIVFNSVSQLEKFGKKAKAAGKGESALSFHRVLGGDNQKGLLQVVGHTAFGDLPLFHALQKGRLSPGSGTVDLIGQQDVGKGRALQEGEFACLLAVDPHAGDVRRQQIRGELDPGEAAA